MSWSKRGAVAGALVCVWSWTLIAQQPTASKSKAAAAPKSGDSTGSSWKGPRAADGHPDFSGIWTYATATPLQRPPALAGKSVLTDAEAAAYEKGLGAGGCRILKCDGTSASRVATAYGDFWWDFGNKLVLNRTSLIVDPPDGLMPAYTPAGQKMAAAAMEARMKAESPDGPEDLSLSDRCLVGFNAGPPLTPSAYNNNIHLFHTKDQLAIVNEMIHSTRIIALDGRPHLSQAVRQWLGDSRGKWDGDTLVVETTNFRPETAPGGGDYLKARLVEKFSRMNRDILMYEYTMDDPAIWTRSWTVQIPLSRSEEPLFEYACHEGNYAIQNILTGARMKEKERTQR
jgi:hypothetical protein